MQLFNWPKIKKWTKGIAIGFAIVYVADAIYASRPRKPICPVEEHSFAGQAFDIEICLNYNSKLTHFGMRVYSKEGAYLAKRMATFAKEGRLNYMAIEDTMIRYSDDTSDLTSASIPEDCVLNMPPTRLDWLEARLPGGIPGYKHCGKASEEIVDRAQAQWDQRVKAEELKHSKPPTWPKPAAPAAPPAAAPASN